MASSHVSFDTIPASIRKPGKYFEFNTRLAVRTLPANVQKVIIIAGKTSEGTLAPLTPVDIYSDLEARTFAGAGSLAHLMCRAAIRAYPYLRLQLVTVEDDSTGLAATGKVVFTGLAESAGVVSLTIGSEVYRTPVARNDSSAVIAASLEKVINRGSLCPVHAVALEGSLALTAKNKGDTGNSICLYITESVMGVSATIQPISGGEVNPDITEALSAIFAEGHNIIVSPYADESNLVLLREHLQATGHAIEQRGAVGIIAMTESLAKATTLAGNSNSGRLVIPLLPGTVSLPGEVAAAFGAVMAGEEDPARPLNTLPLTGIVAPAMPLRMSRMEQETALYNGLTPLEVGPANVVQVVRAVSSYTKDPQGVDDISLLDITTMRTLDYVRKACRERISLRFPREKLSVRTPAKVRSELIDVLLKLEDLEIVERVKENLPMLVVERDGQDSNRLNAIIPCDVVNGLHVFAGRIDLLL